MSSKSYEQRRRHYVNSNIFLTETVEVNTQIVMPKYHIAAILESVAKEGEKRARKPEHYYDSPYPP
jgi:hypothetical protein